MGYWLTKVPGASTDKTSSAEKLASSRIMNGKEAKIHYPWIVQVLHYWKGRSTGSCGGTIITKRYIDELKYDKVENISIKLFEQYTHIFKVNEMRCYKIN